MGRRTRGFGLAIVIGLGAGVAASAQPANGTKALKTAKAAKAAAAGGPSLAVTLAYIRDKLAQQGLIAYAGASHDSADNSNWVNQFTVEATGFTLDEPTCRMVFHWHTTADGKVASDMVDATLNLRTTVSVHVSDMAEDIARINAGAGHTSWTTTVRPPVYVLQAQRNTGEAVTLDFRDRDTADRVAKAIRHGADLCGGTKSEPF